MSVRSSSFRPAEIVGLLLLLALLPTYVSSTADSLPLDFSAFWCAGKAVMLHQDPYLDRSVHQCQVSHGLISSLTIPLPYPPYAVAAFALPALIPYDASAVIWRLFLVAVAVLTAMALRRLANVSWLFAGALAVLQLIAVLPLGQVATVPICAFTWALVFIRDGRTLPASAMLAVTALLPNFAVAAWAAAFLTLRQQRIPLVAIGALLVATSFLAVGAGGVASYLAISSSFSGSIGKWFAQVGTLPLLASMGTPHLAASLIAFALLSVAIALGIIVGLRLRARYGGEHWPVASATAFSVIGAPYLHGWDIGFCLPFALMLWAASRNWKTAAALLLIATPWVHLVEHGGAAGAFAIPFLLVAADAAIGSRLLFAAAAAACITLVSSTLLRLADYAGAPAAAADTRFVAPPVPPNALADVRFDAFLNRPGPKRSGWYERVPTYVELIVLAIVAYRGANERDPQS